MKFKASQILLICMAALCLFVLPDSIHAQIDTDRRWHNGVSEPWWFPEKISQAESAAVQTRWKLIGEENGAPEINEWSGDYFIGDETHGSYLRLSPNHGFVLLQVNKCAAQVEDFSHGRITFSPSSIQLIPERSLDANGSHGHGHRPQMSNSFIPVKFRGDRLLIPENAMPDFGDYVAGLGKFNGAVFYYYVISSPFFYKMSNRLITEATDFPIVPAGYEHFLKQPIEAQIMSVGKRIVKRDYSYETPYGQSTTYVYASITYVTVNVGTTNRAKPWLQMNVMGSDEAVILTRVGKTSSTGIIIRSLTEAGEEKYFDSETDQEKIYPKVAIGLKLTTSPFE